MASIVGNKMRACNIRGLKAGGGEGHLSYCNFIHRESHVGCNRSSGVRRRRVAGDIYGQFAVDQSIFPGFCFKLPLIGLSFIRHRMSGQYVNVQLCCVTGQLTDGGSFSVQHVITACYGRGVPASCSALPQRVGAI